MFFSSIYLLPIDWILLSPTAGKHMMEMGLSSCILWVIISQAHATSIPTEDPVTIAEGEISQDLTCITSETEATASWSTTQTVNVENQPTTTLPSCLHIEICRNGRESGICPKEGSCECSSVPNGPKFFFGITCDMLNLSMTTQVTSRRTLNITWSSVPKMRGQYLFIYRKAPADGGKDIFKEPLKKINSRTVRLVNLDAGSVDYVVCLMNKDLAGSVYDTKNISRLDTQYEDCVLVSTKTGVVWGQQIAFYLVCASMGLILLVIFFVGCIKESLDKKNYHLFDNGGEHGDSEEHDVGLVDDMSGDKDDLDNTCAIEESTTNIALETV